MAAIGLQISVYYALAGLAVVIAYRRLILRSVANTVFIGVWPLAGALFMAFLFVENCRSLPGTQLAIGLGALAVGLLPMAWYWIGGSAYYRRGPGLAASSGGVSSDGVSTGGVSTGGAATGAGGADSSAGGAAGAASST